MVIGGTVVDITATARKDMSVSMLHSSFPGTTRISLGGVGRNVAEAVSKLNAEGCVFVSAVGGAGAKSEIGDGEQGDTVADDLFGPWLIGEIDRKGLHNLEIHQVPGARTATYTALHDATGNLLSAVADMDVFELLPPTKVKEAIMKHRPKTVCFDGNISSECMRTIMETCRDHNIQTFFEPTSVVKCVRPLEESALDALLDGALNFASPNEYELQKMAISARRLISDHKHHVRLRELKDRPVHGGLQDPEDVAVAITSGDNSAYKSLLLEAFSVSQFIPTLFIKLGAKGVLVFQRTTGAKLRMAAIVEGSVEEEEEDKRKMPADIEDWTQSGEIKWKLFPAHDVDSIKSVTGAGDSGDKLAQFG
ncbi:Ribokinase-like protein [Dissophora ornata]|nr:Ribokinase-like protein [Dissophora ornata]